MILIIKKKLKIYIKKFFSSYNNKSWFDSNYYDRFISYLYKSIKIIENISKTYKKEKDIQDLFGSLYKNKIGKFSKDDIVAFIKFAF